MANATRTSETHGKHNGKNLVLTKKASSFKKKKQRKKKHKLCPRGARCADNHRGERCCAQASMRSREKDVVGKSALERAG